MIVDDEPFIRQGLKILIDWEKHGFTISGEAANGKEAVKLMENIDVDLILTDIKMPQMDGMELIRYTKENISQDIGFIILSGFYEFEYAKKAIKYGVSDYILKPIQKEELIRTLEGCKEQYRQEKEKQKRLEHSEKIVFDRYLFHMISGNPYKESLDYVNKYLVDNTQARFINFEYDLSDEKYSILSDGEKIKAMDLLYDALKTFLKDDWFHAYRETGRYDNEYTVGLIYVKKLAETAELCEKEYINELYQSINSGLEYKVILYIGQRVDNIEQISESYKSSLIATTFERLSKRKGMSYYEEIQGMINTNKYPFDKKMMDELIYAIEENDEITIHKMIDDIYIHLKTLMAEPKLVEINLNYLIYNLVNLANDLDPDSDKEEIYKMICEDDYKNIAVRGSIKHFRKFVIEFADYLNQLRQNAHGGVLTEIKKEITENYKSNLTLKSLSEKYYINSAYLGQIFKKKYGSSFKDYLNSYRVDRAAELLIRTDEKIYTISSAVGFNNTDYFICKFVQIKGITPLQYRKQAVKQKI